MQFFKPEDFDVASHFPGEMQRSVVWASIANAKLEREGIQVRGWLDRLVGAEFAEKYNQTTHTALLINIEAIKKCEHPKDKLSITSFIAVKELKSLPPMMGAAMYAFPNTTVEIHCECGAKITPTAFEEIK